MGLVPPQSTRSFAASKAGRREVIKLHIKGFQQNEEIKLYEDVTRGQQMT
jgi:hypothetical protein